MTVGEALMEIKNYHDPYNPSDQNVVIIDNSNHYSGTASYFLNNGAFDYLRQKTVLCFKGNAILVNNVLANI